MNLNSNLNNNRIMTQKQQRSSPSSSLLSPSSQSIIGASGPNSLAIQCRQQPLSLQRPLNNSLSSPPSSSRLMLFEQMMMTTTTTMRKFETESEQQHEKSGAKNNLVSYLYFLKFVLHTIIHV